MTTPNHACADRLGPSRPVALTLIALVALLGCTLAAAPKASAFELSSSECAYSSYVNACWAEAEGGALLVLKGEIPYEASLETGTKAILKGTLGGEEVDVECAAASISRTTGLLLQANPTSEDDTWDAVLTLGECHLTGKLGEKCSVPTELTTNTIVGEPSLTELGQVTFANTANAGVILTLEIKQKSKCPATILGNHKLTGKQLATLGTPNETLAAHTLTTTEKSELLLGENEANLKLGLHITIPEENYWDYTKGSPFELSSSECAYSSYVNACWAEAEGGTLLVLKGEIPYEASLETGTKAILKGTLGSEEVDVECAAASISRTTGLLLQANPTSEDDTWDAVLTLGECQLTGELGEKCSVPTELTTNTIVGEPSLTELGQITFANTANAGVILTLEIKQKSKCPATVIGNHKLTGKQLATLGTPNETLAAHTLTTTEKSELLLGENEASLKLGLHVTIPEENYWDYVGE